MTPALIDGLVQAQASASSWLIEPSATCSPERKRVPVSLVDASYGPTVGANYRGNLATNARGWLIIDAAKRTSSGPGSESERVPDRTRDVPRFGALLGDNTPSPALQGLRMMTMIKWW